MHEAERPVIVAARATLQEGHWPLPIPRRQKAPRLKGWQDLRLLQSDLASYFEKESNIGVLLGKPSGGLVDVDLDATEVLSIADSFLPLTNRIHGRPSKPQSHRWYVCDPPPLPMKFSDTDGQCLVELRSTGQQAVIPPSIHPSGEEVYWEQRGDAAIVQGPQLLWSVAHLAAASILVRHWPNRGSRHETALALHGLLLRSEWSTEEAERFVGVVASAAGDEQWRSRAADGRSTAKRLAAGETATGKPRLVEIFGKEIVERLSVWLGLTQKHGAVVEQMNLGLTDLGNAKRFALTYRRDVRFSRRRRKWLMWNGQRWVWDDTGTVQEDAKQTAIAILSEAREERDDEKRKKLIAWQKQSEFEHSIRAMITLAQSEDGIPVRIEELDCDPMLFNLQNGTMNLTTEEFSEHRREDLITKIAPISYDLTAACPQWLAFLSRIMNGNNELIAFLQRVVGYSLTGDTSEHALFLLYGNGANGKTTFLEVLRHVFGDYVMTADFGSFVVSRGSSVRNDLARLAGARLVTAVESEANRRLAEEVIKQITGGDTITARYLYSEHFEFRPQFKLFLATNHKPRIRGTDVAIWRRTHLIPFAVTIPNEEQDKELPMKLRAEGPGILRWALEGLTGWRRSGLSAPAEVTDATRDYRTEQDVVQHFIDERCISDPGALTPASELYTAYKKWCEAGGESPSCKRDFGLALHGRGFQKIRSGTSRRWAGVRVSVKDDA